MRIRFWTTVLLALTVAAGCRRDPEPPADADSSSSAPIVNRRAVASTLIGTDMPFDPKDRPGDVVVRRNHQFEDVPVPHGYKLRRDKVVSFQGSVFRFGEFTYEGHTSAPAVSAFYREMLPKEGWSMAASALHNGVERLQYRKGDEFCDLVIRDNREYTRVDISVYDPRHLAARASYMARAGHVSRAPSPAVASPAPGRANFAPSGEPIFTDFAGVTTLAPMDTRLLVPQELPDGTLILVPAG